MRIDLTIRRASLAAWLALWFFGPFAAAFAASVRVELSTPTAEVGEELAYQVIIGDGSLERLPDFPKVDGLLATGASQVNSTTRYSPGAGLTRTAVYQYRLSPQREGRIVIPPFELTVDGEKFMTRELILTVQPGLKAENPGDIAYARLEASRSRVFVGEDVPVDLICYLEAEMPEGDTRWAGNEAIALDGEGYSTRGMLRQNVATRDFAQVSEARVESGGKKYIRVVFRVVVTPNRAGKLVIGPVRARLLYSRAMNSGLLSPRYGSARPLNILTPPVEIEAQPLPVEGRPADFTGAIGDFQFTAQGRPARVKIGEPITMSLLVSGKGNFDRIGAPALAQPAGWRAYPPPNDFEPADLLSMSGKKTFQMVVVPEVKKDAMPVFHFSYFDPYQEKYITRVSTAAPLEVEGEPAPAPAPAASEPPLPAAAPARDILGIQPLPGFWGTLGTLPVPAFWAVLAAPALLLGVALGWRARRSDRGRQKRAGLLREKAALWARVEKTNDRAELFDAAGRILQIEVALATGRPLDGIDEAAVLAYGDSPAVQRLFAARAELVYAGSRSGAVTQNDRDAALDVLEQFGRLRR